MVMPTWLLGKRSVMTERGSGIEPEFYGPTEIRSGAGRRRQVRARARRAGEHGGRGRGGGGRVRDYARRGRRRVVARELVDVGGVGQEPAVARPGDHVRRRRVPEVSRMSG